MLYYMFILPNKDEFWEIWVAMFHKIIAKYTFLQQFAIEADNDQNHPRICGYLDVENRLFSSLQKNLSILNDDLTTLSEY